MDYDLLKVGEVVEGRYKILRPIADGGMGTVFLAEHWLMKRRVALKVLHAELAQDATMLRRFMNEALAAGTLGHPNIVESTDMGFTRDDVPYIVFEYLEGTVLGDEILRARQLRIPRALKIAYQIASALEAAHAANIVHRDLKSDNIFLIERQGERDHVKVLDFGISRFLAASERTVAGGRVLGTPEFMAPEQALSPETIDHRVDIYALGVVLYEMLTGSVPFALAHRGGFPTDEEAQILLDRIINDKPPPITRPDMPAGLAKLIEERLLAKVPKWRFQSMAEVQTALGAFMEGGPPVRKRRATKAEMIAMSDKTVSTLELSTVELEREVRALGKRWTLVDGDLAVSLQHSDIRKLASVVSAIAAIVHEMQHDVTLHLEVPHLRITLPEARLVIDLVLAARIETWLRDNGW